MTQLGFQTEFSVLVWKRNEGIISWYSLKVGRQKMEENRKYKKTYIKFGNIKKGMYI